MTEDTYPVRWTGLQAVVTLPERIDSSNAGQVRELLLGVIDRGATVLVADLSATTSCDYSGAEALHRAYQRAIAGGTELRLAACADGVRGVLALSGLGRPTLAYPTLEAAVAAGAGSAAVQGVPGTPASVAGAGHTGRADELLDSVVKTVFEVGMSLQAAIGLPPEAARRHITAALRSLDEVVREVREYVFAERTRPGLAARPSGNVHERVALIGNRMALLHERVMQTAYALHSAAADTAALLEQRADLVEQTGRVDYPVEIKRWRALARQAEQMAERLQQMQERLCTPFHARSRSSAGALRREGRIWVPSLAARTPQARRLELGLAPSGGRGWGWRFRAGWQKRQVRHRVWASGHLAVPVPGGFFLIPDSGEAVHRARSQV